MKFILLLVLFPLTLLYIPLNRQVPKFSFKLMIDNYIPLLPWTVWIYFFYYPLFPISIAILWNSRFIIPFLATQILATAFASLIWRVFPNGVSRPGIESTYNRTYKFLHLIYSHDKDCNGLPSGHVIHTFVACFFLAKLFPQIWVVFFLILMAISLSTLTTQQHYFIDMVFTLTVSPIIIELSSLLIY